MIRGAILEEHLKKEYEGKAQQELLQKAKMMNASFEGARLAFGAIIMKVRGGIDPAYDDFFMMELPIVHDLSNEFAGLIKQVEFAK